VFSGAKAFVFSVFSVAKAFVFSVFSVANRSPCSPWRYFVGLGGAVSFDATLFLNLHRPFSRTS
jgi:hypothetical protein